MIGFLGYNNPIFKFEERNVVSGMALLEAWAPLFKSRKETWKSKVSVQIIMAIDKLLKYIYNS